jgi:6-pyruvoyltetrahydropterin/6-carboxytetrahydropterin synthase
LRYDAGVYELSVKRDFRATHAVEINGIREESHGHDWGVELVVSGAQLDRDGILCDFHDLQRELDRILDGLNDHDLNQTPPFDRINPTAEHVARYLGETVRAALPEMIALDHVTVTEAPGCAATYRVRHL